MGIVLGVCVWRGGGQSKWEWGRDLFVIMVLTELRIYLHPLSSLSRTCLLEDSGAPGATPISTCRNRGLGAKPGVAAGLADLEG